MRFLIYNCLVSCTCLQLLYTFIPLSLFWLTFYSIFLLKYLSDMAGTETARSLNKSSTAGTRQHCYRDVKFTKANFSLFYGGANETTNFQPYEPVHLDSGLI